MNGVLKQGVRRTISDCKGIEKAAAAAERQTSTAGLWNNLNKRDMPPVDCAVDMDAVAIANGGDAHITAAMAADLGRVLVTLPDAMAVEDCWNRITADLATEQADLLGGLLRDLVDRKIQKHEAETRRRDVQAVLAVVVAVDQRLRAIAEGEG